MDVKPAVLDHPGSLVHAACLAFVEILHLQQYRLCSLCLPPPPFLYAACLQSWPARIAELAALTSLVGTMPAAQTWHETAEAVVLAGSQTLGFAAWTSQAGCQGTKPATRESAHYMLWFIQASAHQYVQATAYSAPRPCFLIVLAACSVTGC